MPKPFVLPTLYGRLEPTTDREVPDKKDFVLYADKTASDPVSRYPWHYTKPTRRNKYVTHNCATYRLEWLPEGEW